MTRRLILLLLAAACVGRAATTITIINQDGAGEGLNDATPAAPVGGNTGTTVGAQRLTVMQRAAALWAARLSSPVTIQVGAKFDPLTCSESSAVLGSTGPHTAMRDFAGAPKANTYYAVALANALAGSDLDPGAVDMDAVFNSNLGQAGCLSFYQWYYGLDGNAPANTIDLLGVVLHEFAHGLGFLTFVDLTTGAKFSGFNDTFMVNLEDHSTGKLYPAMSNAERVAASINSGNLHWVGTNLLNAAGFLAAGRDASGHVQMYAPNPQQPGSSVSHWDTSLSPDELMEPYDNPVSDRRLTEQLFRDLGWTVLPPIQTNGQVIVSEGCFNGAIDPGETVTVEFTLKNNGFANVANLSATLLAANGVTAPSAPQSYGAMTVLGTGVTRAFSFTATGICGGAISPTFHLQDGAMDYGNVSFFFRLGGTREFTNATLISIPNSGAAAPYPSTITISNHAGPLNGLGVRLLGINHNNPDDLDVLLVGPGGQKVLLMSDCGGSPNLANVSILFSDFAGAFLSDANQLTSGTFKPSNYDTNTDIITAPAPDAPYSTNLSAFDGTNPNGTWQLFVMDDTNPTSGTISGGWALVLPDCCAGAGNQSPSITFSAAPANYVENAPPLVLAPDALVTDGDSTNFNGGSLTVAFTTNGTAADQLSTTNSGGIVLSVGAVTFNGLAVGNATGGTNGTALVVNFTSTNATPAAAQALVRAVTFFNTSDAPSTNARTVRFTVNDGAGGAGLAMKTVNVTAVNDAPTILPVTDRSTPEDTTTGAIAFTIGDAETAAASLTVSGTSSNTALTPSLVFGGSASNRTVTILPATNQSGTALITLFVSDGQLTNSTGFLLTVTPVNDTPVISAVSNRTIFEDTNTGAIAFTIGDVETAAGALTVFGTSTNTALVPDANIVFGGTGSNRTVTITPATNQNGVTRITLFVSDGAATNSTNFLLTVTAVNDAPVISSVPGRTMLENTNTGAVSFTVSDVETAAGALTVSGVSSNSALVPNANLVFSGSGSNRFVTVTPATNQIGTTLVTLRVSDGAASNSTSFLLGVLPVVDLAVTNSLVFDGTNFVATITLTNPGPRAASSVTLSNPLPPGASVVALNSDAATCATTNSAAVCTFPSLAANTGAVVTLTLTLWPADSFTNFSFVSAAETDLNPGNNVAVAILPGVGAGDFDGDGLPDGWELAYGTNPLFADANDDPDHDGLTNLQEFFAGTDPHDAGSVLRVTHLALESGTNTVALSFLAVSNLSYSILSATNPVIGPWKKILDVPAAAAKGVITLTNLPGADAMRFYRVVTPHLP